MPDHGHKVLATASTGIAATKFYAGSMTLHSAFRFGINHRPGQIPQIQFGSYFGRRIIESDVVIIDEITLLEMTLLENVDLLCRTMVPSKRDIPFAGKVVILSGDWKQSLPVVRNSSIPEMAVPVCIQSSYLYKMFLKTRLLQNMRLQPSEIQFKQWLYNLGTNTSREKIALPKSMMVETRDELISFVFDQGFNINSSQLLTRLMLAPTNRSVDLNNDLILSSFNSQSRDYYSVDRCLTDDPLDPYAAEQDVSYINKLTPSGLPAHHLHLKVGSIIVLLINLNTSKGLCNGTRLKIVALRDHLIEAETIYGVNQGVTVGLSRSRMQHQDPQDGVSFVRLQFPVRTAFCMTITKAQGQTCERLGIDFSDEPFAHGQLYTALSRCTNSNFIRIFAPNKPKDNDGNTLITNVVARGIQFD
uniref:ATP-dependent DNA helicase n=2 Tax=Meloidogyne TaxID=189290 RepID=A0A914NFW6_MELIC